MAANATIFRSMTKTKDGNRLELFYNPENNLVVVDLVAKSGKGGCEIIRTKINEKKLLKHLK